MLYSILEKGEYDAQREALFVLTNSITMLQDQ